MVFCQDLFLPVGSAKAATLCNFFTKNSLFALISSISSKYLSISFLHLWHSQLSLPKLVLSNNSNRNLSLVASALSPYNFNFLAFAVPLLTSLQRAQQSAISHFEGRGLNVAVKEFYTQHPVVLERSAYRLVPRPFPFRMGLATRDYLYVMVRKKRKATRSYPHRSRSRSPIKTRSSSHQVKRGPIKLSRERPPPGAVGASSNKHVQRTFLAMMGFITEDIDIEKILEILSDELANLLACANKHRFSKILYKHNIRDGYYIAEEIEEALVKFGKFEEKDNGDDDIPTCRCVAHQNIKYFNDRYEEDFCELIRSPPEMNNNDGKKFVVALINIILYHAGRTNFVIKPTEQGTEYC